VGTGYNLSTALLAAYIYFFSAAISWHLSRGRLWIVLLTLFLTACAATGASAYLYLTVNHLEPENIINPNSLLSPDDPADHPSPDAKTNPFLRNLVPESALEGRVLMPPGYGGWVGAFHSMEAGQAVICLAILSLIEALRRRRTDWPWICCSFHPF